MFTHVKSITWNVSQILLINDKTFMWLKKKKQSKFWEIRGNIKIFFFPKLFPK